MASTVVSISIYVMLLLLCVCAVNFTAPVAGYVSAVSAVNYSCVVVVLPPLLLLLII